MKTEFRKLILMTRESRRASLTDSMRELGFLHIELGRPDIPEENESLIHEQNLTHRLVRFLENQLEPAPLSSEQKQKSVKEVIGELLKIEEATEEIDQKIEKLEKKQVHLSPWGDYDYRKFEPLFDQGLHVFLCRADKKSFSQIDRSQDLVEIMSQKGSDVYFVVITRLEDYEAPYEHFLLPKAPPSAIAAEITQLREKKTALEGSLQQYAAYMSDLSAYRMAIDDAISLNTACASFEEHFEGKLISLSAWFPADREQEVMQFMEQEGVAWKIRPPHQGEDVPVLLKNKKYPSLFEPITKIFELPNYHETDLTPFLAVFYPILFAYCLGDAGYGFVLTVAMVAGYFSFLKGSRNMAVLGIILGVITMIMGLIKSGSLFGIMLLPDHPAAWVRQLAKWVIIPDDSSRIFNAFNVALMIGVIQIISGVVIAVYNKLKHEGLPDAIAPFGKLLIVVSLIWIFLVDMQELATLDVLGSFRKYLLILGVSLVVFFHNIDLSILKRVGGAFMPLFFIFTGILGDVLSYVRLFALGLASSVLGLVVNQIGLQIMEGGILSIVIGVLFLLFGHTLNFGIAALGSFVHPLRLTFVEFYGNAGFQGKGIPYRPFSKSKQT